eukprot:CAMPEP_0194304804 /NCGR_PEP_ID=MMETSP0171-20130528/2425_1 /TAXON_ID=218684 /ORGANISM="Corethron pennatum, Strain L29A3" /LENGTH=821 /DNA_ID=CAMNT_0039056163 /DNA_START=130 /DNA_END=2591 /DNA_ORIENTATION=-
MGLLKVGKPKSFAESKTDLTYVRLAGVRQFISTYNRVKTLTNDELLWGEEVEYGIFSIDKQSKKIKLSLRAKEVMDKLNENERSHSHRSEGCNWVPEYGAWMIEATPGRPYTGFTNDLLRVEPNMRLRRSRLLTVLHDDEIAPTVTGYPLLGVHGTDDLPTNGPVANSDYISDAIINPHPRFGTLTANIRARRGSNVNIRVPLFRDTNTPEFAGSTKLDNICDSLKVWPYSRQEADPDGKEMVAMGCSVTALGSDFGSVKSDPVTLSKYLVNVKGAVGIFYRSAPGTIVANADWPRNGDIVTGFEFNSSDMKERWVRLQNGYYLPMESRDGKIKFLHPVNQSDPSTQYQTFGTGKSIETDESGIRQNISGGSIPALRMTRSSSGEDLIHYASVSAQSLRPAIHMDAMAFGMGCCCLQVTFQNRDVEESRFIYDQIAVMAPIMMALTASTSILKGRLADTDCRWGVISECVDCRTPAERGCVSSDEPDPLMAGKGARRLYKSRYDSISTYIYQGVENNGSTETDRVINKYNDIPVEIDEEAYAILRDAGIDPALSQHVAHLFVRDPLVVFEGSVKEVDDNIMTEHFESIQSTNWQTVRWKPPPPRLEPNDPHIGWRTEFRSMEMQLTDFENAAYTVFIVLLSRAIIAFDLNLYLPLSRVDANMQRAHSRDAVNKMKFFFRRHLAPLVEGDDGYGVAYKSIFTQKDNADASYVGGADEKNSYEEMTIAEIFMGKSDYFPGLIPLIHAYLDFVHCDSSTKKKLMEYLTIIEKRAKGELLTPAMWMRKFVQSHPAYKFDSVVSEEIAHDLMVACKEIGEGTRHEP